LTFDDATSALGSNELCRTYGVTIFDIDGDGVPEIIVNAADKNNLILKRKSADPGSDFEDVAPPEFAAPLSSSLCTVVGDFLGTGTPCLYTLNSDVFAGPKRQRDTLLVRRSPACDDAPLHFGDLGALHPALVNPYAGRSVVAVDLHGRGRHSFFVAGYGAPSLLFSFNTEEARPEEVSQALGMAMAQKGRGLVAQSLVSHRSMDVFCANEDGPNRLFARTRGGKFRDVASDLGLDLPNLDARGVAVCDLDGKGRLDLLLCHWEGEPRFYVQTALAQFEDRTPFLARDEKKYRNIVVADFDNDGFDEVFLNCFDGPNRLFRYCGYDAWDEIPLGDAAFALFQGTGCAVGDLNNDGFLDLYVSNGEKEGQVNTLLYSRPNGNSWLRVQPLTRVGFPALGARVRLLCTPGRGRNQTKVVCSGSGYLCQMEPVAHFGLGEGADIEAIEIYWPGDGVAVPYTRIDRPSARNTTLQVFPPAGISQG
jgi:hypothetical protein